MRKLHPFAISEEENRVLADDVAASERLHADFAARPLPDLLRRARRRSELPLPSAAATSSASRSAVPDGASFFIRWWVSRISTSKVSPKISASSVAILIIKFTPIDMFGDIITAIFCEQRPTSALASDESPVEPMTSGTPRSAQMRAFSTLASALVKSITT